MLVAVTGASGHLGAHLVRRLLARGDRVRALLHGDHPATALRGLGVEVVHGDVLDPATLPGLVEGADVVFHLAAWISIDGDHGGKVTRVNVEGPRNVVAAAAAAGCRRVVHVSSVHAIDLRVHREVDETTPRTLAPDRDPYDRSKALGELAALDEAEKRGIGIVVVRPTGCMGPLDFGPSLFGGALLGMLRGSFPALVAGGFDWVDMRDVADGALAALERGRDGEVYLLGCERWSIRDLAEMACEVTGRRPPPVIPYGLAYTVAPVAELWGRATGTKARFTRAALHALECFPHVSWAKAHAELGYAPRPIRTTVVDTASWFVAYGMLDRRRVAIELPEAAK
jgi:dihydroflavonol-4-reductase